MVVGPGNGNAAGVGGGGVSPGEILGIGVDATASTQLAVDEQGGPLLPAIMWMDVRASEEAARIGETGDSALKYSGYGGGFDITLTPPGTQ